MRRRVEKKNGSVEQFHRSIVIVFVAIIIAMTTFFALIIGGRVSDSVSSEVSRLIAANSRQLQLNINDYIEKVEKSATLMFSDEQYYLYDATNTSMDDYDKIQCEEAIMNRIVDLGLLDNYADFAIIYADDHTVGWISNTTVDLYHGKLYASFSSYITDEKTNDAWVCGKEGNFDRMYYVKRLNPNAVLVVSFYNNELNSVFDYPEEISGMTVRLTDETNRILYSSDKDEIGSMLPDNVALQIENAESVSAKNQDLIVNSHTCGNHWKVICTVPMEIILHEVRALNQFIIIFAVAICIISIVVAYFLLRKITKPMDGMMSGLQARATYDSLSGLLNKASFEENVTEKMKTMPAGTIHVFGMCDVDNFKCVNDMLGHASGDALIKEIGSLLLDIYGTRAITGRVGGDEFAIYNTYDASDAENVYEKVQLAMAYLLDRFHESFAKKYEKCDISLSVGVKIAREDLAFDTLYRSADKALYESKQEGKNKFTIWKEGEMHEKKDL